MSRDSGSRVLGSGLAAPDLAPLLGPYPGKPGYFCAAGVMTGQAGGIGRTIAEHRSHRIYPQQQFAAGRPVRTTPIYHRLKEAGAVLGASLALGYVRTPAAQEGAAAEVLVKGERRRAMLTLDPRFDPAGARMRS